MGLGPDALRSISHDMRNLLTAVRGHAELALRGLSPEDPAREDVAHCVVVTGALFELIDQLDGVDTSHTLVATNLDSAVNAMRNSVLRVLGYEGEPEGGEWDELRGRMRVIPHQANGRIVDGLAKKLDLPTEKVTKTIYRVGNISAASNMIALDYAYRHGNLLVDREPGTEKILAIKEHKDPIRRGEIVVLPSIGAGYLYGAVAFVPA